MKDKRTKSDLIQRVSELEEDLRRANRTILQMSLDLDVKIHVDITAHIAPKPTDEVKTALTRAENEFDLNIIDGINNKHILDKYIRGSEGLGWTWVEDYHNGSFEWCGAYAAYCYGPKLRSTIRMRTLPSCYRMYRDWRDTERCVNGQDIKLGDIVTVWNSAIPERREATPQGNHIVVVRTVPENGEFTTWEGNAKGYGPSGKWREGVSTRSRKVSTIANVYRLLQGDFND